MRQLRGGSKRRGREVVRVGLLVLVAGVLSLSYVCLGCNGNKARTRSQVQADIDKQERRRSQIEDELASYGGHVENGEWQVDYMGPLTRGGTRQNINNLINEWHECNGHIDDLSDELGGARPDPNHSDASRSAAGAATNVGPPVRGGVGCGCSN